MAVDNSTIRSLCEAESGYAEATAYDRTKTCCRLLVEHGEPIPSWMVIREIIGKGSSADISRGVRDFRREHAATLRQMSGIVPGVPERLAPYIRGFWEAAVAAVRDEFNASVKRWEEQIAQADARAGQAETGLSDAQATVRQLEAQLEASRQAFARLENQLAAEQATRLQAERMFEAHAKEVNVQRERLETMLKESKDELERAIARLDGERRNALLQIEDARSKASKEIANIRAQADREKSALGAVNATLNGTITELRDKAAAVERHNAALQQEIADLRPRLSRAEALADKLAEDNRQLAAGVRNRLATVAGSGVSKVGKVKRLRGRR